MILAAHQPQYLPWLGYFAKMDRADVFVLLDSVQFKKNEWQNRNRVRGAAGSQWLTVPVRHRFRQRIHEVQIAGDGWQRKHRATLEQSYARLPFMEKEADLLDALYGRPWRTLSSLNVECVRLLAERFSIETPIRLSSEIDGVPDDQADDRLIALCRALGADTYLAGAGGQAYMDLARWESAGLQVVFQEFHHPRYPQGREPFLPALSAVDLLFACGRDGFARVREAQESVRAAARDGAPVEVA